MFVCFIFYRLFKERDILNMPDTVVTPLHCGLDEEKKMTERERVKQKKG